MVIVDIGISRLKKVRDSEIRDSGIAISTRNAASFPAERRLLCTSYQFSFAICQLYVHKISILQ